ncbi:MAG: enoyl-CoA hydratase-related protein [Hyphomicrobiaceae bacterium]
MSVVYTLSDDRVARVEINRPTRMNAIDPATEAELERIWSEIESDKTVRCVVLTGAGDRAFSAGADMKAADTASGLEYWAGRNPNGFGGIALRQSMKVPVIARVNGVALGGGMEMVLGADIVVASETAKLGLTEARVGRLPLDGGMVKLPRLIPEKIAAGMMMTGRMIPAAEAARYGLVNAVVPFDELDEEVANWTRDIIACAPLSVAAIKVTMGKTRHLLPAEARTFHTPELIVALQSEDQDEGVAAFLEKRKPVWKGK